MIARLLTRALAWGARLPAALHPVVGALLALGADVAWLRRARGVRRLEANLARVRPGLDPRALRRLSRAGMRSYLRYYGEALTLPALRPEQVRARVRLVGGEPLRAVLAGDGSAVLALGHCGNWDLAGAFAALELRPVTTVAERLEPPELFERYVELRSAVGMNVLPLDAGGGVFRALVRAVRGDGALVALLADRDLTSHGVEVELFGRPARVAAGPAALSLATGAPLFPTSCHYERLRGARRRAARSRWGIVLTVAPAVVAPEGERGAQVAAMTQAWVDALAADIARHPQDWHMLQRVFAEDLDPGRAP